jgi:hypothetical protein
MTTELRSAMIDAGFTEVYIATLESTMQYQAASKAENNTAVRDYAFYALKLLKASTKTKANTDTTAVSNPKHDYDRIKTIAYSLFGGFGRGQITYLLRYADADTIIRLMYDLRRDSWKYGWTRTRNAVESLKAA